MSTTSSARDVLCRAMDATSCTSSASLPSATSPSHPTHPTVTVLATSTALVQQPRVHYPTRVTTSTPLDPQHFIPGFDNAVAAFSDGQGGRRARRRRRTHPGRCPHCCCCRRSLRRQPAPDVPEFLPPSRVLIRQTGYLPAGASVSWPLSSYVIIILCFRRYHGACLLWLPCFSVAFDSSCILVGRN